MRDQWIDVRCGNPSCNKLLLRVRGLAEIETVCPRCRSKNMWPSMKVEVVLKDARTKKVLDSSRLSTAGSSCSGSRN